MEADRLAPAIDLALEDMDKIDRRIGLAPDLSRHRALRFGRSKASATLPRTSPRKPEQQKRTEQKQHACDAHFPAPVDEGFSRANKAPTLSTRNGRRHVYRRFHQVDRQNSLTRNAKPHYFLPAR